MQPGTKPSNGNSIILASTRESSNGSDKSLEFPDWIINQLTILGEAFGERWTDERQEIYCTGLLDIPQEQLKIAFKRACYELKWFPKLAELRELAGAPCESEKDGRPGPEEAWARMPKGGRAEEDSVVWCEEERIAYFGCRDLMREGDLVGARMAFKERYEREVAESRSQRRPPTWSVSVGFDVEHRLVTLASAIQQERIKPRTALPFIPDERRNDFVQMLPPKHAKGLLEGEVQTLPTLPGLAGVLAKMRIENTIPDEIKPDKPYPYKATSDMSSDDWRRRREELKAQGAFLRRSRTALGGTTAGGS
jgi:hypothetical protein